MSNALNVTDPVIAVVRKEQGPPSVLLIEDSSHDADMAKRILYRLGCAVQVTPDGPSALAAIAAQKPEIIFLDLGLPGMDGPALWVEIRKLTCEVPIIIITNPVNLAMLNRIPTGGYIAVAEKPLTEHYAREIFATHKIRMLEAKP